MSDTFTYFKQSHLFKDFCRVCNLLTSGYRSYKTTQATRRTRSQTVIVELKTIFYDSTISLIVGVTKVLNTKGMSDTPPIL